MCCQQCFVATFLGLKENLDADRERKEGPYLGGVLETAPLALSAHLLDRCTAVFPTIDAPEARVPVRGTAASRAYNSSIWLRYHTPASSALHSISTVARRS